jgi:streptogramin lyase
MRKPNQTTLFFLVISLALLFWLPSRAARADLTAQEINLAVSGQPWEANLDSQGMLWISHLFPAEIWRVNTLSGAVTVYPVGGEPSDGRGDGSGMLWWADLASNRLNRLNTANNQVHAWQIPSSAGLYTTAINAQGQVWVMDFFSPNLYRLDPATNQLCTFPLPNGGTGNYLAADGQSVWYGDNLNSRLVRLDPLGNTFEFWLLPDYGYTLDLAVDASGNLWYTDTSLNQLGRLDPLLDSLTIYTLPLNYDPQMLSLADGKAWLSFQDPGNPGGVARLDPAAASGTVYPAPNASQAVSPSCTTLAPTFSATLTPSTSQPAWNGQNYPVSYSQDGWLAFGLPENGLPFGLATGEQVWLVDQGRGKLARLDYPAQVTAGALQDEDGDLGTPATWSGLQPGMAYGVSQDSPPGWSALAGSEHSFGTLAPDQVSSHTFINQQTSILLFLPLTFR